jgi:hypothetical protein
MYRTCLLLIACLGLPETTRAELPLVDRGSLRQLQAHVRDLLNALDELGHGLPEKQKQALEPLLAEKEGTAESLLAIQRLLDPHCLIGVTINPESRVKAARGPATAELLQEKRRVFLVKVHNDAGVTQALTLTGPQLAEQAADDERWLRASFDRKPPLKEKLSGQTVEYLLLVCETARAGKREAKLIFDVGQGTQDLGFRAEVPILFTTRGQP